MDVATKVLPMRKRKSGHILNFSSIGGLTSFPTLGLYDATKYATEEFQKRLFNSSRPSALKRRLSSQAPSGRTGQAVGPQNRDFPLRIIKELLRSRGRQPQYNAAVRKKGDPEKAAQGSSM
ncbi:MAG: SDR family NAD(P)-dependent oxidoreductase [Deltaproteobacteria bacterium]|jgi:NAD(P)-dependent dehydrogenase (short-subunit alcohol dehydrogenase family)|nr:SDR family NAD(P)-dependent oxidoreductase [Deltaproteobacteria bacterium]